MRTVLYRELYKGVIVWGQTKKRDAWGRRHSQDLPESQWMRVPAQHLRIVDDKLWSAAHRELRSASAAYLRDSNGRLWGRPPQGVESKYLLPGLARCVACNGGLMVRLGTSGPGTRAYCCSSYHQRGKGSMRERTARAYEDRRRGGPQGLREAVR